VTTSLSDSGSGPYAGGTIVYRGSNGWAIFPGYPADLLFEVCDDTEVYETVQSDTGTGSVIFVTDQGAIGNLDALALSDLPADAQATKPKFNFVHGFFDCSITGLENGASVTLSITFPSSIPDKWVWWNYIEGQGWSSLPIGSNDGDEVITITKTDGGVGDADGVANGVITDPGGIAEAILPTVTTFQINNGAAVVRRRNVTLNNTCTENPTHYMASENSSFIGAVWNAYSTAPTFRLSLGYGDKTVYFKAKNDEGESPAIFDTIEFKMPLPRVTLFRINNGAATTTSRNVTLNNTCTKNPTYYKASENPTLMGVGWKAYSTAPTFRLSAGNGTKRVYFRVKNAGGQSTIVSDSITKN